MKKILVLIFSLLLVGCSESVNEEVNNTPEPTATAEAISFEDYNEEIKDFYLGNNLPDNVIKAIIHTNYGSIELNLFPDSAPLAVENFVTHAKNDYYDGVIFHRVIDNFMIQGGDPLGTGFGGESIWNEGFETEFDGKLYHFYGAISMANTGQANTNGSQFFIVDSKAMTSNTISNLGSAGYPTSAIELYEEYNGTYFLDTLHPVFGYVSKGMDIVELISEVEVDSNDKPVEDVIITDIEIIDGE